MYQPGELIVYGRTGVCRVERVDRRDGQDFYVLTPLYQSCDIYAPVNGKIFMRPIISRQEANALIDGIPAYASEACEGLPLRELTEHYQAAIATHDCKDLFEMTMSIYTKKRTAERDKKKFGAVDERFMKEGEALLFGELAAALEIPVEEVKSYISQRLTQAAGGKTRPAVEV